LPTRCCPDKTPAPPLRNLPSFFVLSGLAFLCSYASFSHAVGPVPFLPPRSLNFFVPVSCSFHRPQALSPTAVFGGVGFFHPVGVLLSLFQKLSESFNPSPPPSLADVLRGPFPLINSVTKTVFSLFPIFSDLLFSPLFFLLVPGVAFLWPPVAFSSPRIAVPSSLPFLSFFVVFSLVTLLVLFSHARVPPLFEGVRRSNWNQAFSFFITAPLSFF